MAGHGEYFNSNQESAFFGEGSKIKDEKVAKVIWSPGKNPLWSLSHYVPYRKTTSGLPVLFMTQGIGNRLANTAGIFKREFKVINLFRPECPAGVFGPIGHIACGAGVLLFFLSPLLKR
jgi:hypothetical protein